MIPGGCAKRTTISRGTAGPPHERAAAEHRACRVRIAIRTIRRDRSQASMRTVEPLYLLRTANQFRHRATTLRVAAQCFATLGNAAQLNATKRAVLRGGPFIFNLPICRRAVHWPRDFRTASHREHDRQECGMARPLPIWPWALV